QASDLLKHPGDLDGLAATRTVVRRYLTALGYTAYNAMREEDGHGCGSCPYTSRPATPPRHSGCCCLSAQASPTTSNAPKRILIGLSHLLPIPRSIATETCLQGRPTVRRRPGYTAVSLARQR